MDGATQTVEQKPPTLANQGVSTDDERSAAILKGAGLGMEGVEEDAAAAERADVVPSRKRRGCEDGSDGDGEIENGHRKKRRLGSGDCDIAGECLGASTIVSGAAGAMKSPHQSRSQFASPLSRRVAGANTSNHRSPQNIPASPLHTPRTAPAGGRCSTPAGPHHTPVEHLVQLYRDAHEQLHTGGKEAAWRLEEVGSEAFARQPKLPR
ncbi:hypothetical protein N2152v2_010856 [Parachlorella kessleri]